LSSAFAPVVQRADEGEQDFRSSSGIFSEIRETTNGGISRGEDLYSIQSWVDEAKRPHLWRSVARLSELVHAASPTPMHHVLKYMQDMGLVSSVLTQNVDNLERAAGIKVTDQLHGSVDILRCTRCSEAFHWSSEQSEQLDTSEDRPILNGTWGPRVIALMKEGKDIWCGICYAGRLPGMQRLTALIIHHLYLKQSIQIDQVSPPTRNCSIWR
jgi:hypothetical protein